MRWRESTPAAVRAAARSALATLPAAIPEIRRYELGPDLGLANGNFDFALVAEFDEPAAFARYAAHPAHLAVLAEHFKPHLDARVAVQYALEGPAGAG